ncbi:hypothetical protein BASA50_000701 [Batrachochytrium salamandrivorans]|uniref:Uncharacterized protein n=1 Tax=Batrachochytrium salamandrivorans TaxID=1357716 RepID=A0ABQ8ETC2_9FUNG|nr:hypothetical protein BASA50_000701 [Batrachochytrium salamandrivorans]
MKLSGVFVAAMVITSVNAGWLSDLFGDIKIHPIRLSATSSSTSNSGLDIFQKQRKDNPIIDYMFNSDQEHNDMLIKMFNTQEKILGLASDIETESSKYRTTMKLTNHLTQAELAERFNSDNTNYQNIMDLLDKIDECLIKFDESQFIYLSEYLPLPEGCPILGLNLLQTIAKIAKNGLIQID